MTVSLTKYWDPKFKGVSLNEKDRQRFDATGSNWVYGEVTETGIQQMMDLVPRHQGTFVDLGSGRGNICCYVYLNYGYDLSVGVELSEGRWQLSEEITRLATEEHDLSGVQFIKEDLFDHDLSTTNTVFSNNIAFGNENNHKLYQKFDRELPQGAFIILTRWIPDTTLYPRIELHGRATVETSWMDNCPLYVYQIQ